MWRASYLQSGDRDAAKRPKFESLYFFHHISAQVLNLNHFDGHRSFMIFVFEDGEHVEIGGQQTHSFMSHDLNWAEKAHGRLVNVLYGRAAAAENAISSTAEQVVEMPLRESEKHASSGPGMVRRVSGTTPVPCCA